MKIILDTNVVISVVISGIFVSGDNHLLKISGYKGIKVLKPREFIDHYLT